VCPHRGAPLSQGWVSEVQGHDCVVCPYHGWAFDEEGVLRDVPAAEKAEAWPRKQLVDSYAVQEKVCHECPWHAVDSSMHICSACTNVVVHARETIYWSEACAHCPLPSGTTFLVVCIVHHFLWCLSAQKVGAATGCCITQGGFVWLFYGSKTFPADERPPIPYVPELDDPTWKPVYGM